MAKNYALINASISPSKRPYTTNWTLCVLHQVDTKAALECPARPKKPNFGTGYKLLAKHLIQFQSHGHTYAIYINRLDNGDGIEAH